MLPNDFSDSVLKHNSQIGIRNSKAGTISGAHNQDAFLESADVVEAKISNKITDARFPGVVEYTYQLPRTNQQGELIGGFKPVSTKTTYDPAVLPDNRIVDMSNRAAIKAEASFKEQPNLRELNVSVDGYYFRVTRDKHTGQINNSFIPCHLGRTNEG